MKKNILTLFAVIIGLTANIGLLHAETDNWSAYTEAVIPSDNTYNITSAEQLAWIASQVNAEESNSFEGKTIKLENNIDLAAHEWTPIGNVIGKQVNGFKGTFNGNNKTISNMTITLNDEGAENVKAGLFAFILDKAIVKDVTVTGSITIEASLVAVAGGIVGKATGTPNEKGNDTSFTGSIENCHSAVSINTTITPKNDLKKEGDNSSFAGGIAGEVFATGLTSANPDYPKVIKCSSTGSVTSICTTGNVTNGILAGGILGRAQSVKIQNCYSTGNMTSTGGKMPYAGGIVGHVSYDVQILDCYSMGDIASSSSRSEETWGIAGGICGFFSKNSIAENCYATGGISASLPSTSDAGSEVWASGIVGYSSSNGTQIKNCAAFNGTISTAGASLKAEKKAAQRILGKNDGKTIMTTNYASSKINVTKDGAAQTATDNASGEDGAAMVSSDLSTLFTSENGWTLSGTTLPTLTDCGTTTQTGKNQSEYFTPNSDLKTLLSRDDVTNIELKAGTIYDFSSESLNINKAVTITSNVYNKAIIRGNICIEADDVALNNLKIETVSTGTKYWQKNAVSVIGKKVTITTCDFEGSIQDGHAGEWVVNGIVLFPTEAAPEYKVTGNTFKMFKGTTSDKKWTATAIIMADGYTLDKKENGQVVLPAASNFNETAIANANTYTNCFADYIHMTDKKYVYSRTQSADGVAEAWLSMDKGTINAPAVTNEAVLKALNGTAKPALADKAIAIRCSDAWLVTDESLAGSDLPVLVITKAEGGDYEAVKNTVAPVVDNSTLTTSTIEAGQTLSASILSGGKATVDGKDIAGTFTWEDPTTVAKEGDQTYPVIFTPNDLSSYSAAKTTYTFSAEKAIKQYYTVTTGKCENGSVEIKEANAANRYLKGSTLTLVYHPDANYKTKANTTLAVEKDEVVTTTFEAIMHTVTIAAGANGSVSVNGTAYSGSSNTISVPQGSELAVQVIPATDYVGSLTCSDSKVISNGVVTVDKPFTITGSFTKKPADEFVVSVPAVQNGKILLYDEDGNAINAGSSVVSGTEVSVLAVPDLGYKLTSDGLKNNGSSITGGKITVSAAASITAAFEKQTFAVTTTGDNATITISGTGSESLDKVPYGTTLTASVKPNDGYKLLSLVVNGKEIADGGTFTVTAATEVKAVMRQLATIVIDKTPQTFVYDGNTKEFVVKTIPAGIGGFSVTYDAVPQDAADHDEKAYKVTITRKADDVYAAVSQEIEGGLVILAADMKGVAIPTASEGNLGSNPNPDLGDYAWENGNVGNDEPIHDAIFTPTSRNYKKSTFSILTGNGTTPEVVTLDWGGLQTRSNTTPNVTFSVNGGSLAVLNGSTALSSGSGKLYVGQKIRLVATPDAIHAAKVTWDVSGGGRLSDETATEATLTLAENTTVTATFADMSSPEFPGLEGLDKAVYDGTIYGTGTPAIKEGTVKDNWSIAFKQGDVATSTPINAGTYDIYVSRPADAIYSAVIDQKAGSFTIAQKQVTASVTAATSVLKGQSLAQSVLSGTADVDGSFVWIDPTVLMTTTGDQKAKFVPANANYKESGELTTKVTVTEATGVTLRTLNVNITNPEKGTVTMTLNGSEVVAGASVTKDDKLIVTYVATAADYKASATIGGSDYKSGAEYIVPESGNVEVAVSFVFNNSNPGTDPDPDPSTVDVTGITLEPTCKTLAVNETLALKATVAPTDATDTGVSWSSSAPDIVSVDTKGNVKALKAGTATITATTNDGGFTATCKISVSVPTGIEDILSGTRVYAQDGSIVLEPAMTIQVLVSDMTGRVIWQGKLSEKKQMAVSAGVYIVRLSNANGVQTQKVIVQ